MDLSYETRVPTPLSNSTLLPLLLLSLATQRHTPLTSDTFKKEYDYIIVGGGAAGCVLASRLSENPCVSILLLEAGDKPPLLTEVPGLARYLPKYDRNWHFKTVPQKYTASALINRQIRWTAGKMLGGSGSINGLAYVRGNYRDYDNWAAMGAEGWSYDDVFPYFLKLEDNRNWEYLANGYHAVGGPITVESPSYYPELKQAVYDAALELGFEIVDSNAEKQLDRHRHSAENGNEWIKLGNIPLHHSLGFYASQGFTRNHQRCSSLKAYLVPAENRQNLGILTNAFATKIILEDNKATGIEFLYNGKMQVVKARKEVIVSAGTENTPKLLMLSGIGPREELNKLGIPVVVDLPVGKNLHNDAGTYYLFTLDEQFQGFDQKVTDPSNILQYINYRTGPLASLNSVNVAFLRCMNESGPADYPDFEVYFHELRDSFAEGLGLKPEVYKQVFEPYKGQVLYSCSVQMLAPKSRGTITLNSSNPFDSPLIDPNFLEVPTDVTIVVQGLKTCKKILDTSPLLQLHAKPLETLIPGCEKYFGNDDEYFKCWAKTMFFTFHHPVGTSKMGDPADPTTVVDPELRVKGVKGLRVIDASIMPVGPRGNTFIPTVMIAEKASDMIKSCITC